MHSERLTRTARGWDAAADGYEAYFVPRFAPWVTDGVAAVTAGVVPDGPVLVPCCGTFPELAPLTGRLPGRDLVGIDLSAGMVRLATARAAGRPDVRVHQGDASSLDPRWTGRCAAVVSVFGLQQLPEPATAIAAWTAALRPGGRLSVLYWPGVTETDGPFAVLAAILGGAAPHPWEDDLVPAITAAGAVLERDEPVAHPMTHRDAATYFAAHSHSGPMRATALERGDAYIDGIRTEFLHRAPAGEWHHRPAARLLVARRQAA